jgi:hypothetical protein
MVGMYHGIMLVGTREYVWDNDSVTGNEIPYAGHHRIEVKLIGWQSVDWLAIS